MYTEECGEASALEYHVRKLPHYSVGDAARQGQNRDDGVVLCGVSFNLLALILLFPGLKSFKIKEKNHINSLCSSTALINCLKADVLR